MSIFFSLFQIYTVYSKGFFTFHCALGQKDDTTIGYWEYFLTPVITYDSNITGTSISLLVFQWRHRGSTQHQPVTRVSFEAVWWMQPFWSAKLIREVFSFHVSICIKALKKKSTLNIRREIHLYALINNIIAHLFWNTGWDWVLQSETLSKRVMGGKGMV